MLDMACLSHWVFSLTSDESRQAENQKKFCQILTQKTKKLNKKTTNSKTFFLNKETIPHQNKICQIYCIIRLLTLFLSLKIN